MSPTDTRVTAVPTFTTLPDSSVHAGKVNSPLPEERNFSICRVNISFSQKKLLKLNKT